MAMNPMVESKKSPNKQIEDNNNYHNNYPLEV